MKRRFNRLLAGMVAIVMGLSGYGNSAVLAADDNDAVSGSVSESAICEDVDEEDDEICEMEFMSLSENDLVDPEELNRDFDDQEEFILEATANFTPRTTAPTSDNEYFFKSKYNPFVGTSYGPPATTSNCTWYAYGRASEILGRKAGLCTKNASNWYGWTQDGYQRGDTPRLGAVACKRGANHVAVVEGIDYSSNKVTLSNSAWQGRSFYLSTVDASAYQYIYLGDFSTDNTNPPYITSAEVSEVNRVSGYYTVKAIVTAEAGLDRVQFPTWTAYNDQDDIVSDWGTSSRVRGSVTHLGNNQYLAQYTAYMSEHNGERGTYYTHIYAYDKYGRSSEAKAVSVDMNMEGSAPSVLSAKVTEVNRSEGYYNVVAKVHADAALDRIEFPTWTSYNGQDDLPASWPKGEVRSLGNNDYEATYTVRISDHNNEKGQYNTHVYAFDCYGRNGMFILDSIDMNDYPTEPIKFGVNLAAKGKVNVYNMICEKWGAKIKIVKFVSSDKKIASVNNKGIVTGKKDGTVTITAYVKAGKERVEAGSITINVSKPVFRFTNIDLTYTGKSISARDHIINLPAGAEIKWSIPKGSQKIAAIDENTGVIVAGEKSGNVNVKCTISAYGYSCKYTAKLRVKLPKPSKSINIKDGKSKLVGINNVSNYTSVSWRSSSSALIIETTSKPYKVKVTADSVKDPSALTQPVILTAVIDGIEYKTNVVIKP